jgi:hypothetical protein
MQALQFVACSLSLYLLAAAQTIPGLIANDDQTELDSQPARAFFVTIRDALNREDFDQLEQIAASARSEKSRFTGGDWKLRSFYLVIQGPGRLTAPDAVWTHHIERLQRWAAAKPASITPRVAIGSAYTRYAWKARGNGFANTVTADGWKLFQERIENARSTLEQAESFPMKDPQLYNALQVVALAQRWNRAQMDQLVQQGMALEPDYFYFYVAETNFLMPKWHGQPGDAENFAQSAADRVGGPEGDFIYFRIAASENCCRSVQLPNLAWDRVKRGFAALEQLHGSTNRQRNVAAQMAVANHDREFAQQLFARIGNDWDAVVWGSKEKFDASKTMFSAAN